MKSALNVLNISCAELKRSLLRHEPGKVELSGPAPAASVADCRSRAVFECSFLAWWVVGHYFQPDYCWKPCLQEVADLDSCRHLAAGPASSAAPHHLQSSSLLRLDS